MKILYVCHRLPYPPVRGGKIRPFNTIRHLARTHQVTVATLAHSADEAAQGAALADHCHAVIVERTHAVSRLLRAAACVPTAVPSTMGYFHSPRLARRLDAAIARVGYDLVLVHSSSMMRYVLPAAGPTIADFGDVDSQKWLAYGRHKPWPSAWLYRLEGHKLQRAEARLAAACDVGTCTTRAELETLRSLAVDTPLDWFPNGVDTEYFRARGAAYDPDTICFVGRMDYYPNQQAALELCREILPLLRAARPALQLLIVGAEPPRAIRRLAALPGVRVTGTVADVRPLLERAALSVAPLRIARGTQNKILESLAMGVPVVCSTLAAGGVDAVPGEHLVTADGPRACADAVLRLLDDPAARARLAQAGRARVESHHAWAASMQRLDAIIARCLAARRTGVPPRPRMDVGMG
ncbi:MAG: TIGR03087 family PEP-CTERM/XrtA system glycosyltransferase [Deltaproteobacteria bacterium]|nr:TIGR03087 family PEP-CTERM/XrtA system glycosyltransferase [Deltaproteobacteria bacterium]